MSHSAKSLFYFGIYVALTGLLFISIPDMFTSLTQLPAIPSGWARVVGLLALVIGSYDIITGKENIQPLIKASIYIRYGFALGTILVVVTGLMPVTLILLGAVDALGATWTMLALKSESAKS